MTLADLREKAHYLSDDEWTLVEKAYTMAAARHEGQLRRSGDPYVSHPLEVATILAELELDSESIIAALLHDLVEDTRTTLEQIRNAFGTEVARLVDGVTKLSQLEDMSRQEQEAENIRKMVMAMAKDLRVVLIKLADRLHNMRTLRYLDDQRQLAIANETLEIYAPLAHRLGIYRLKWELEDLSLRHLHPDAYQRIAELVAERRVEREGYLIEVSAQLLRALREHGLSAEVQARPKSFYSIYQKMYERQKQFEAIYDLMAIRVVVSTVHDCYAALGIVHTIWKPMPGRFKDYIAMPKSNLYQSLHTTVFGPDGRVFEVQIRTAEMHRIAEYGVAAHWVYKEHETAQVFDSKLSWLRQLLEWQHELRDSNEFVETLKIDLFQDEVFVFTPKGQVLDLPRGATPVDFAYRIHTDVGHHCVGGRVNGRIVQLEYQLHNGDIVEIMTNKNSAGPSLDWLNFVKTSSARQRIRQFFKAKLKEENIAYGRELVERDLRRQGLDPVQCMKPEWIEEVRERFNMHSVDALWAAIGFGGLSPGHVATRLKEKLPPKEPAFIGGDLRSFPGYGRPSNGVRVRGADNLLVRFSRCCTPVPGDPIIGYISRGKGVSVHRMDCPNAAALGREKERVVDVTWDLGQGQAYPVEIEVHASDRSGLLADVARVVAETRVNILSAKARGFRNKSAIVDVVLEIQNLAELRGIVEQLRRLPDVYAVERTARQKMS